LDAKFIGNETRFINSASVERCNLEARFSYYRGYTTIFFRAKRDILAGEELFFNYGKGYEVKGMIDPPYHVPKIKNGPKKILKRKAMEIEIN
jgi:SET domain-containing protein